MAGMWKQLTAYITWYGEGYHKHGGNYSFAYKTAENMETVILANSEINSMLYGKTYCRTLKQD